MNPSRKPRTCASCRKPKTIASFGRGETRCRLCVRTGVEIHPDTPLDVTGRPKRGRLCAVCAVERPAYQFNRRDGQTAECCDLCTSDPGIRVTLRQVDVATVVMRSLRQIASGRHDCVDGPLTLGVEAMREIARAALKKIEEAI